MRNSLFPFIILLSMTSLRAQGQPLHLPGKFVHSVYFWLNDPESESDRQAFLASLYKFVQHSEYITAYHVAPPANTPREVVDNSYTFNLVATFESRELQDLYQNEQIHKDFIAEAGHLWKEVRIFDSFREDEPPATESFYRPDISIGVVVRDLSKSMAFYQEVIGMQKTGDFTVDGSFATRSGLTGGPPMKVTIMKLVSSTYAPEYKLMQITGAGENQATNFIQEQNGLRYITLQVENITPFIDRIKAHGIEFQGETPLPLDNGNTFVLVRDPDGIFIEIIGPAK